ncbi:MAG TPA: alpha/beta hydrolase [Firmicutes bacterium]|nr:alpha/beta hydrolase [Bacillota bacterium]
MNGQTPIKIWPESTGIPTTLTPYFPADHKEPTGAVIVCPGGGYAVKAPHEGEPIAQWLTSLGIVAFVLDYRVAPHRYPAGLLDVRRAVQYVRSRAQEWAIHKDKIGVLGFSAGGHLVSSLGTVTAPLETGCRDEVAEEDYLPNALILCYPVIALFGKYAHRGSATNLLGPEATEDQRLGLSTHRLVTPQTPPTFLWHTADDAVVPVENSLMFAEALSENKVPFELHIYPHGPHGMGLAEEDPQVGQWTKACGTWLKQLGF